MAEVKKILVVIFMISIITTSLYMLLPGNEIFEASPPENSITAQEFFADNYYFSPYNQNDSWLIYDSVDECLLFYLPELDLLNRTYNAHNLSEYTAIKFNSSESYLYMIGNEIEQFEPGEDVSYNETTVWVENYERIPRIASGGAELPYENGAYRAETWVVFERITWLKQIQNKTSDYNMSFIHSNNELRINIIDIPEYYPYPVTWSSIEMSVVDYDISETMSSGGTSFNEFIVQKNNVTLYDSNHPEDYSSDLIIEEGQSIIIRYNLNYRLDVHFSTNKFEHSDSLFKLSWYA